MLVEETRPGAVQRTLITMCAMHVWLRLQNSGGSKSTPVSLILIFAEVRHNPMRQGRMGWEHMARQPKATHANWPLAVFRHYRRIHVRSNAGDDFRGFG